MIQAGQQERPWVRSTRHAEFVLSINAPKSHAVFFKAAESSRNNASVGFGCRAYGNRFGAAATARVGDPFCQFRQSCQSSRRLASKAGSEGTRLEKRCHPAWVRVGLMG